jgi:release factor glutamine methyltransferase
VFEHILTLYRAMCDQGVDEPLAETLRVADLLSAGALQEADLALAGEAVSAVDLARQRREGVPLEYIVGRAIYWGMVLEVSPETFIPRQETELLVSIALDWIQDRLLGQEEVLVADVGTGCGNIALALAASSSQVRVLATEVSPGAAEVAQRNVARHNLEDQVSVLCGDLFVPLQGTEAMGTVDLVVCNPPYIPTGSLDRLGAEVVGHEPRVALDGGAQGTDLLARLIAGAASVLRPGGLLVFETGRGPDEHAVGLLSEGGVYRDVTCYESAEQVCAMSAIRKQRASGYM